MLRLTPPAGPSVKLGEVVRASRRLFSANGNRQQFLESFTSRLRVRHALGVSSGRAALCVILQALRALKPDRDVVAIPAYTCFSVPAAIVRAGLKLQPIEMDPETLDFDREKLQETTPERLLAVVTSNLFGLVNRMAPVRKVAAAAGAFVVDDGAQALGGVSAGRPAGTLGDVGFYSFARGKPLAAWTGALIVTDSEEIFASIQGLIARLPSSSKLQDSRLMLMMMAGALFQKPELYWIPDSLPFLKLGVTEFEPGFPVESLPRPARCLLPFLLEHLEEWNHIRAQNAQVLADSLQDKGFTLPQAAQDCRPTYIRFPVLADDRVTRDRAVDALRRAGIGASPFYPAAVCDIPGIGAHMAVPGVHCPQAEGIAQRLFTLPTHPLVAPADLRRMTEVLSSL